MYYQCCVCKTLRKDAITLYHFPGSEKRLMKWLNCLQNHGFEIVSSEQLSKTFICEKHFEERFISPSTLRLKANAYPSLFTQDEIASGIPSHENIENVDPLKEHAYALKTHSDHNYSKQVTQRAHSGIEAIPSTSKAKTIPVDPLLPEGEGLLRQPTDTVGAISCSSLEGHLQAQDAAHSGIEAISSTSEVKTAPVNSLLPEGLLKQPTDTVEAMPDSSLEGHLQTQDAGVVKDAIRPKKRRKRFIGKLINLTPTGRLIYNEYKKSKRQADFHLRASRALRFNKETTFHKLTKGMNPYAKTILKMQISLCKKPKKGRRFSLEEKLIALSIMKQSPKCYRFLHKIFILPSRSTLNKMVAGLRIESGICPQVFEVMKRGTENWNEKKKMCSMIFDEISLEAGLTYDKKKDKINGLVELVERKNEYADHALVFMLRGAVYKWQQPIAFYFCQGATKAVELNQILAKIITAVVGCGLNPISLICDQGSAFQAALNNLKRDTAREQVLANQQPGGTVTISGVNLMVIFDPPHLIKGLRNNFLNKNISIEGKISSWQDIVDVYETDCNNTETRILHKLNDQHVIPEKIKKMKVKNCVKVFSYTVSSALSYTANFSHYADGRPVSETLKNTAETVLFFDKLFDSVNGSATCPKKKGKDLRCAVTEKSAHHEFWPESIEKLQKMKYIDSRGNPKSVPSLKNFISTIRTFMRLWQFFRSNNMALMRPRFFNSDPIENFFGQVRAYNYRNNDPDCHSFMNTFKSLLITRMIKFHSNTYNCEDDSAEQIVNLKALFDDQLAESVEPGHPKIGDVEPVVEEAQREQLNVLHSRAYTAGWVVTKTLKKFNNDCSRCYKCLTTKEGAIHKWINEKEYNAATKRLTYPSKGAVRCFGTIIKETNGFLEHHAHETHLAAKIMENIMSKNPFGFFKCAEHQETLHYFISIIITFSVTNWCNNINKILNGTDIARIINRTLPAMHQKALDKYKKRLRNKSLNK